MTTIVLTKDCWYLIAMQCEWPEVWSLNQVCHATHKACSTVIRSKSRSVISLGVTAVADHERSNNNVMSLVREMINKVKPSVRFCDENGDDCEETNYTMMCNRVKQKLDDCFYRFYLMDTQKV